MTWVQLRSRRDPAFWAPLLLVVLLLVPLSLSLHAWMTGWLAGLRETASSDPKTALAEAMRALRWLEWALVVVSGGFSAYLFRFFQLGLRESRLPPSGWWSLGAYRVAIGPRARRMSKVGRVLSVVLLAATIGFVIALEYLLRIILEGKLAT